MIKTTIEQLERITAEVRTKFGPLSAVEINRKPNSDNWSVAQCLEHLIKTNELFFGELESIGLGKRTNSFWENWSPLTGIGGRFLIKSLKSDEKKFKVPTNRIAPASDVDPDIVEIFAKHQEELIGKLKACESTDLEKIVVTSPFLKLMTYSLKNGLEVIVEHEKRHFRQAERVLKG